MGAGVQLLLLLLLLLQLPIPLLPLLHIHPPSLLVAPGSSTSTLCLQPGPAIVAVAAWTSSFSLPGPWFMHTDLDPISTICHPLLVPCTPNPAAIVVATAATASAPGGGAVPSFSVVPVLELGPLNWTYPLLLTSVLPLPLACLMVCVNWEPCKISN